MKVALVQEHIDPRRGGAETSTLEMARHLAARGLDVTVVCSASSAAETERVPKSAYNVHPLSIPGTSRTQRTISFVSAADQFCRMAGFDVVHAVTPCLSASIYQPRGGTYVETVRRSVRLGRSPVGRLLKWVGRRFNQRQRFLLLLERELLNGTPPPYVACVSDYVRRQVEADFALPADRLRVVFNGVDIEPLPEEEAALERAAFRQQCRVSDQQPLVLFVAHNFKLKGLAELIRATATPTGRATDWVAVVAGRDAPQRYQRLAARLHITERLRFVGTDTPIRVLYAAADALAHPTWYDPCSRVVLEALSVGLPVATTRYNGAAEALAGKLHGEVLDDPGHAERLAGAIQRCLDPELSRACRGAAAGLRERLSMARHARELHALYEDVLAERSRAAAGERPVQFSEGAR
ncbi:MAG: glycosyltransferase family 4 protein [Planctomycetes bacterium]|nr:glycosyltransferase family 4 protein [Planctomycetota bacterium]